MPKEAEKKKRRSRKKAAAQRFAVLGLCLGTAVVALCYVSLFLPSEKAAAADSPESLSVPETTAAPEDIGDEETGILPGDSLLPVEAESSPTSTVYLVLDDAGQSLSQLELFLALPFPLTVAVLPRLPRSVEAAKKARDRGKAVILHQPMRARDPAYNPGAGAIEPGMEASEIRRLVNENIEGIAPISGVNNHEGSAVTSDTAQMTAVLEVCRERGLYFLDSRTTALSAVPEAAKALGMRIYERDVFLDNTQNTQDMLREFRRGLNIARKQGSVIMIGHVWSPRLAVLLREQYPEAEKQGFRFALLQQDKN